MRNFQFHLPYSVVTMCYGTVGVLMVTYIGLIAVVMTYATITMEFSQSMKNDEAAIALLESHYLSGVAHVESLDYRTVGYTVPMVKMFVPATSVTALR